MEDVYEPYHSLHSPRIDPSLGNHSSSSSHLEAIQMQTNISSLAEQGGHEDSPDRILPSTDITDESLEDAYVAFILYCNPMIPTSTDTAELRKGLRSPPRSDGKVFDTFALFGLIKRLETKEIKTWTQLVIELGVDPPDSAKNQSTQKVQQYAVRLKRWLHAFHVDAFFQYCLGVSNVYYTKRPKKEESLSDAVRDGIPPEDDLALRALLPEFRPKRGRRKADGIESDNTVLAKRVHVEDPDTIRPSTTFEEDYSAYPRSALPWSPQSSQPDTWTSHVAIAPKTTVAEGLRSSPQPVVQPAGQQIRWRLNDENTPLTPYPQSAITPRHLRSLSPSFDEPQSAHPSTNSGTSASARSRKRRGPAVSAAWPGSSNAATGKLRGRPPSNRSTQNGPFTTFPVNPHSKTGPNSVLDPPNLALSPSPSHDHLVEDAARDSQLTMTPSPQPVVPPQLLAKGPKKLQLQVPQHLGGPVRLATPPRVLINGESNRQSSLLALGQERRTSADFFKDLDDTSREGPEENGSDEIEDVDWKRRALTLKRKLQEKEEELRDLKRRVIQAVM